MERPQAEVVIRLADSLQNGFASRDHDIDLVRRLRYMEEKVDIPDPYERTTIEVRLPIVNDQIERLVANLTLNGFTIHVPPPRPGPVGQTRASRLERGLTALWKRLEKESGGHLFHNSADGAVETGEAILKILWRPDRWDMPTRTSDESDEDYLGRVAEKKRGSKLPLAARLVDRRNFYPEYDEDGLARVVEISKRRISDIYRDFGSAETTQAIARAGVPIDQFSDYSVGREVTLVEYWDREWVVYAVVEAVAYGTGRGALLRAFKHGYSRIPYFNGYGAETSSTDPNRKALSAAFPIMYIVPFMNALYTIWSNIAWVTGFPTLTRESPPNTIEGQTDEDSDEDPRETLLIEPGKVLEGLPGTKWNVLNFGPLSTAITGMVAEMKQLSQGSMLPPVASGIPPGSRTSGYAVSELVAMAKAKYSTTVRNLEGMLNEALGFCLELIDTKIQQPIELLTDITDGEGRAYRDWTAIDPDDIKGYYQVDTKIMPRNPVDRQSEGTFMANMHAAGLATKRMAIEEGLGKEQPNEIIDERLVEDWLESPEVAQFIQQQAIREAGLSGLQQEIAAAQQLWETQLRALGMARQGPIPQVPGSAAPGANGLPGGMARPGSPSVRAPSAPGMEVPGMPSLPSPATGQEQQLPRQYRRKGGAPAGAPQRQPGRPPIEGFRGR